MGQDLILYCCANPDNLGLDDAAAKVRISLCASMLTEEQVEDYYDSYGFGLLGLNSYMEEYIHQFGSPPTPTEELSECLVEPPPVQLPEPLSWAREQIEQELLNAYVPVEKGYRDINTFTLCGLDYSFSGGMSYGDEPTESGRQISRLGWLGAFDIPVRKAVLDLSTAHIPESILNENPADLDVVHRCQAHEYGWIVFLGDKEEDKELPEDSWFMPILKLARSSKSDFVNFDRDGDTFNFLPIYTEIE